MYVLLEITSVKIKISRNFPFLKNFFYSSKLPYGLIFHQFFQKIGAKTLN